MRSCSTAADLEIAPLIHLVWGLFPLNVRAFRQLFHGSHWIDFVVLLSIFQQIIPLFHFAASFSSFLLYLLWVCACVFFSLSFSAGVPEKPEINGFTKPAMEGDQITLTCVTSGSKPAADIRWFRNEKEIKGREAWMSPICVQSWSIKILNHVLNGTLHAVKKKPPFLHLAPISLYLK